MSSQENNNNNHYSKEEPRRTGQLSSFQISDNLDKEEDQDQLEHIVTQETLQPKQSETIDIEDELLDEVEDLENIKKQSIKDETRKLYSLSNPTPQQLKRLSGIRKLNALQRFFRPLKRGSLRAVVLLWIRMTMGVGILTLPALLKDFGILGGICALIVGFLVCLISYRFIFEANVKTGVKDYGGLVNELLHPSIAKIFKVTYFLDMISFAIVYSVFGYKLFEFIMYGFGFMKQEWIVNEKELEFSEYNIGLLSVRIIYFIILYIILIPLLLKKKLDALKPISMIFLIVIILLVIDILCEAPFFRNYYKSINDLEVTYTFKKFQWKLIPSLYSIVLSFYVQPFVMTLRKELLSPSYKRLKKVSLLSVGIEVILYIFFACVCYMCFGDKYTADLVILRAPYEGKNKITEYVMRLAIIFFFLLTNIGLCVYNPGMREYLQKFFKIGSERQTHVVLSLVPFFIAFVLSIALPDILSLFWIIGLIFCNFNGFVIPALMKLALLKKHNGSELKIFGCYLLIGTYMTLSIIGICQKIFNF